MLQVVAAVSRHDVQEQQLPPDSAGLAARRGSWQRNDHVGSRHQLGHAVSEAKWPDPGRPASQVSQPTFDTMLAPRYREHVHAGLGQRGGTLHQGTETPTAVNHQHARLARRHTQRRPGRCLGGRGVESGTHRRRYDGHRSSREEAPDRRFRHRRSDQEQIGPFGDPEPVQGHVSAQDDGPPVWCLWLEPRCRRGAGGEHAEHQVSRRPLQICLEGRHEPGGGAPVHEVRQAASGPQVGEVESVVNTGNGDHAGK
jgi:hypothetical protein